MERLTEWNRDHTHGALINGDGYTRLAEYEDTGISPVEINRLISDLHALMWYGDGCEICAHKIVKHMEPFFKLSCDLGDCDNCKPLWIGFSESTT